MALTRRALLASASVLVLAHRAKAWTHGAGVQIGHGWNVLPLGAGGFVTGVSIANDNSLCCRTDVGNIYLWSGKSTDFSDPSKHWIPLLNLSSLGASAVAGVNNGAWELVFAPGNSSVLVSIFCDMTGLNKQWIWYSTNSGGTWNKSNISFLNATAQSNDSTTKFAYYKIAVDPANANIAYCGMPFNSGNSAGVYTTLNQSGGSTLATWAAVTTNGVTPIGAPTSGNLSAGLAIDPSLGTTTVAGQTVTKHIILPIGGVGIYESTDGGVTFTEIAVTAFGTSNFNVFNGGFTAAGVYYCCVQSSTAWGLWRYASGTWANITPSSYTSADFTPQTQTFLMIDPRSGPSNESYLGITASHGIGSGFAATNANTAATPNWTGRTGGEIPALLSASYDLPWINDIFGQGLNAFASATSAVIDSNGTCFWAGNQSFFYFGTSAVDSTPSGPPTYASVNTYSWSMGRGQEATVAQDVLVPPGGTYPILATQDLGNPMRGTFTTYPLHLAVPNEEFNCSSLEYAASDPSFVVARVAGQQVNVDASVYSTNYGADGSWNTIAAHPTFGGVALEGGQTVAVDHDHWVTAPAGFNVASQPAFTANATSPSCSWASCTGLPSAKWYLGSWVDMPTSKPFAVGYGADLGTVWACLFASGTATLYRSTDSGATFASIATWSVSAAAIGVYCLSVPGFPNELWITGCYTGGTNASLWHVTNANTATATVTAITNLPANAALPCAFTLGAPQTGGGYPTLYLLGAASFSAGQFLYKGTYSGSGTTPTWALFGPTGTPADLPNSGNLPNDAGTYGASAIQSIRGDPNVYQRLYACSQQQGLFYFNP